MSSRHRILLLLFFPILISGIAQSCNTIDNQTHIGRGKINSQLSGTHIDSLITLWNSYNRTGQHDLTIQSARPIAIKAMREADSVTAMYAGIFTAQSFLFTENEVDSAKYYADMISRYVKTSGEPSLMINFDNIMGSYYLKTELDYSKALEYYLDGLACAETYGSTQSRIVMLANIVTIFYLRGDGSGMDYAVQAYNAGQENGISEYSKCISLIPMAQMLCLSSKTDEALPYIIEAMRLAHMAEAMTTYTIIHAIYAGICSEQGDTDEAEKHYSTAVRYIDYTDPGTATLVYLEYGNLLSKLKRTQEAIGMYLSGLEISKKSKNMEFRQELLYKTAIMYSKAGDPDTALKYSLKYMTYSDSLVQKKEQDFNRLILSNSQIEHDRQMIAKELEKQKSDRMLVNSLFISLVVCIFACSMFILYRKQLKMYRTLVAQHLATHHEESKPRGKDSSSANRKEIFLKSEKLMKTDKLYRQKDLTQEKFASIVGTNRTYLSQAVNEYSGMSFNSWLNMYRITEATTILSNPDNNMTLKQLADFLGYNSVSVFHRAFQKGTGMTPASWKKTNS